MISELITIFLSILCIFAPGFVSVGQAVKIADVKLVDSLKLGEKSLILNGEGIKKKYWVKIYVCALYLPHKADTADTILTQDEPRCILIHLLYDVSSEKLKKALIRGITKNTSEDELKCLQPQIKQFLCYFSKFETKRGDEIALDYLPDKGTRICVNGREKGIVPGSEFNQALLRIWLGNKPADDDLKARLMGKKNL
jgi:hypothetical protein